MKKKLSLFVLFMVTILTTGILVWNAKENVLASETGNVEYNQLEMPIIAVNTVSGSKISSNKDYTSAQISIINDKGNYEMTKMDMSVRLRGNSTMSTDKKNFKMKFDKGQNLLNIGDSKGKTWSLIANYYDGSLLRNLTVYRFVDLLTGISYSPNCKSVELWLNGQYQGVYLLCEEVNVNKKRVAIKEEPDEVENTGYLMEMSRYDEENKFDVDTASYIIKSELSKNDSTKKRQISYISNYMQESYHALKGGKQNDAEKYINLESLVDIYIANEIVKNVDVGWDSFYLYKDVGGKLCFGPMWDFDLAMGNANCVKGFDSWKGFNVYHILNYNANSNPWFCHALTCKWFRELVEKRWKQLQDKIDNIPNTVRREAESNYKSYCRNFEKWDVLGRQVYIEPTQITELKTFKEHYTYLDNWLTNRVKWLTEYYKSKDFIDGIFVNENGNKLSDIDNLLDIGPILAITNSPQAVMTYEMTPNTGLSVTVQKGGSESWHIQAIASGFMMEKGVEYVLSFDCKCSEERPLSYTVQKNYGTFSPYFKGNLNITNQIQHYETTFTATVNDSNYALAFDLGGDTFKGTTITIDNMKLVKKTTTKD